MTYQVYVTERAYQDIARNSRWWAAHHSHTKSAEWQQAILAKIYALDTFPASHPLARENPDYPYEIREAYFGLGSRPGYRILFTMNEQEVRVLTVKATQEDWLSPGELDF